MTIKSADKAKRFIYTCSKQTGDKTPETDPFIGYRGNGTLPHGEDKLCTSLHYTISLPQSSSVASGVPGSSRSADSRSSSMWHCDDVTEAFEAVDYAVLEHLREISMLLQARSVGYVYSVKQA